MLALSRQTLPALMAWAMTACSAGEPPAPVVKTQTNEQGCVRVRSTGPQDPAAIPVPIKQACVGPYLLELPQNYFYNQMGTESDGSFALALEYPSLKPFLPGERSNLTVDVSVGTIRIDYRFIDRTDPQQVLRNAYTPMQFQRDDPAASLDGRLLGDSIYGLTPYYADMARIRTYLRSQGLRDGAPGMQDRWHTDWFVTRDDKGTVERIIKCTSRGVTSVGVDQRGGKIVRNDERYVAECDHTFTVLDHGTIVRVHYARIGLSEWRRIEAEARRLFLNSIVAGRKGD